MPATTIRRAEPRGATSPRSRSNRRSSIRSSRRGGARSQSFRANRSGASVWEMYESRGFELPGNPGGAAKYLAQHDFVHVLADYGTNVKGELEVFAFIGRADPDPKGFAWLATLIGLFETGYITTTGFFDRDVRERNVRAPGMHRRLADAIRRGKTVSEHYAVDLFDVDYYDLARRSVGEVRGDPRRAAEIAGSPSKGARPVPSTSQACPRPSVGLPRDAEGNPSEPELQPDDRGALRRPGPDHRDARGVGSQPGDERHHGVHGHPGARGSREPGSVLFIADFGVIDPDVSAADEAARNNERPRDPGLREAAARVGRR